MRPSWLALPLAIGVHLSCCRFSSVTVRRRCPGLLVEHVDAQRAGRALKRRRAIGRDQQRAVFSLVFSCGVIPLQENVSICGEGKYLNFREDSRRRNYQEDTSLQRYLLLPIAPPAFSRPAVSLPLVTRSHLRSGKISECQRVRRNQQDVDSARACPVAR